MWLTLIFRQIALPSQEISPNIAKMYTYIIIVQEEDAELPESKIIAHPFDLDALPYKIHLHETANFKYQSYCTHFAQSLRTKKNPEILVPINTNVSDYARYVSVM